MVSLAKSFPDRIQLITLRLRKWFLFSFIIGVITGFLVALLDICVSLLSEQVFSNQSATWYGVILIPVIGLTLTGLILKRVKSGHIHGTEEVIKAFHDPEGNIDTKAAPLKILASILTIGFGGSAGLEGPSIHIGAVAGALANRFLNRLGLKGDDVKTMIIAGGSAGIAAIFKAPLTGIIFGLEVPYKDDFAKESLIPSLIASVSSYMVFVALMGVTPLFKTQQIYVIEYTDLFIAAALGLLVGIAGRAFVAAFRWAEKYFDALKFRQPIKALIGGLVVGATGLVSILLFRTPLSLGIGYNVIGRVISETLTFKTLFGILALRSIATIATLTSGGVGGAFIPMILLGGTIGAMFGKISPERGHLFPIIGMSSFLAAGYKTPLAAVAFVAETTGSPGYIIPGLTAAAVGYIVSGRRSISRNQRWTRLSKMEALLASVAVSEVMTNEPITVPGDITVADFFDGFLLRFRFKSMPVVDGNGKLIGMIALSDINDLSPEKWDETKVEEAMIKDIFVARKNQKLADVLNVMEACNVDRMPVVSDYDKNDLIGIVSSADIIKLSDFTAFWHNRQEAII